MEVLECREKSKQELCCLGTGRRWLRGEGSHTALLWMELAGLQVTGGSWLKTALAQSPGLSEGEGHSRISELQLCCLLRIKKKEYS